VTGDERQRASRVQHVAAGCATIAVVCASAFFLWIAQTGFALRLIWVALITVTACLVIGNLLVYDRSWEPVWPLGFTKVALMANLALCGSVAVLAHLSVANDQGGEYWAVNLPLTLLGASMVLGQVPSLLMLPSAVALHRHKRLPLGVACIAAPAALWITGSLFRIAVLFYAALPAVIVAHGIIFLVLRAKEKKPGKDD
jgi:hypothetical protein